MTAVDAGRVRTPSAGLVNTMGAPRARHDADSIRAAQGLELLRDHVARLEIGHDHEVDGTHPRQEHLSLAPPPR
jgi:hypothetical protein